MGEFQYLEHKVSAECTDEKDAARKIKLPNAVGERLIRKLSHWPEEAEIQL